MLHAISQVPDKVGLTLLHSEKPKLYTILYNFGLSECSRVK